MFQSYLKLTIFEQLNWWGNLNLGWGLSSLPEQRIGKSNQKFMSMLAGHLFYKYNYVSLILMWIIYRFSQA